MRFNFNSRPSARGDAHAFQVRVVLDKFQFTPLREGRRHTPHKPWHGRHFNSRPSARGDQERRERLPNRKNFNSRPSARGDISISMPNVCDFISIHAPPRGATYHQQRSATYRLFQFTPLREGRRITAATQAVSPVFQFTPLREGRPFPVVCQLSDDVFQFTPLREGRPGAPWRCQAPLGFQFTPLREGRQSGSILPGRIFKISIHAPPRGATCREAILFLRLIHFNSRPSARGDF